MPPEPLKGASSMTKIALLLTSTLTVALSSQIAWGRTRAWRKMYKGCLAPR